MPRFFTLLFAASCLTAAGQGEFSLNLDENKTLFAADSVFCLGDLISVSIQIPADYPDTEEVEDVPWSLSFNGNTIPDNQLTEYLWLVGTVGTSISDWSSQSELIFLPLLEGSFTVDVQPYVFLSNTSLDISPLTIEVVNDTSCFESPDSDSNGENQIASLVVETVVVHDGAIPELEGHTTYRIYAELNSPYDFLSAVTGNGLFPLALECENGAIYNSSFGADFADQINPLLYDFFPELEFDSWFTIGSESSDTETFVLSVGDSFSDAMSSFNAGEGFLINDAIGGGWFNTFDCSISNSYSPEQSELELCAQGNSAFAGEDNRVLLAQITTNGTISGVFNLQVFPNGSQPDDQEFDGLTFSSNPNAVFGCTDSLANNFNPEASTDDLSCIFDCSLELNLVDIIQPECFGSGNGGIELDASGVQGEDYFFLNYIPEGALEDPAAYGGQNLGYLYGLTAGYYYVWVLDGAGCVDSMGVQVPEPADIEINLVLTDSVTCAGSNDAVLTLESVEGGNGGYESYFLSQIGGSLFIEPSSPLYQWSNLAGDASYYVHLRDSLGCYGQSNYIFIPEGPPCSSGCTDMSACNYDPSAQDDDGSCLYLDECGVCGGFGISDDACDCEGNILDVIGVCGGTCQSDHDNNGVCDNQEVFGCAYPVAENYSVDVTHDDGSCIFPCEGEVNTNVFDWDGDYLVTVTDFLMMLSVYGDTDVDLDGVWDSGDDCVDTNACNYASDPSQPCSFLDVLSVCGGGCESDEDNDGICDDIDTCIGIEDECGVCNGLGPTEIVIEEIVITYDSVFLPLDNDWYVFPVSADTTFTFTCAPPSFSTCGDPVSYQGYEYATVLIGDQCWFAENLRNQNYDNGDAIPSGLSDSEWTSTTSGATAVYGEGTSTCNTNSPDGDACDDAWSLSEYGRLYNWHAVDDSRGLCPSGWHVPTDVEWTVMTDFSLGGSSVAGGQMKTTYGWMNGSNGTNSSGFSGLPGGGLFDDGYFSSAGGTGYWWSSSPIGSYAWTRYLNFYPPENVDRINYAHRFGLSVRCIKD